MLPLEPSDIKLNFYYDETNNIRKFYLTDDKNNYMNSESNLFILGGIAIDPLLLENIHFETSLHALFKKWGVQATQKEVKFKHIANGDFLTILKSKKLNYLFEFLSEKNIFIHMFVLDVIHWSLIDIIESTNAFNVCKRFLCIDEYIFYEIKSLLTEVARTFKKDFFRELFELGYPAVRDKKYDFICFLKKYLYKYTLLIEYKDPNIHPLFIYVLLKIFDEFERNDKVSDAFCFLEGELPHRLIEYFDNFYLFAIKQFPSSSHFFDEEKNVEKGLEIYRSKYSNYKFIKSESDKLIQLSDIVVGFFRCLFDYLSSIDYINIERNYENLSCEQRKSLKTFFEVYEKSVNEDVRMVIFTWSMFDFYKFNRLRSLCKTV